MSISTEVWGKSPKGKPVHKFTMTNAMGASVTVIEWGAIVTSIIVPDAGGNMDDVALGFDSLDRYLGPHGCLGDCVGRYGNRIGAGKFSIDGVDYQVALNDVAYVRFAAVYRKFTDVGTFMDELQKLVDEKM